MKQKHDKTVCRLEDLVDIFFHTDFAFDRSDIECLKGSLQAFCKSGNKSDAFSVYFCFCELFGVFGRGYDTMSKLLEFLCDHEYHAGELLTKHRDHYSHSVYVLALGLAIYANDAKFRGIFHDFYREKASDAQSFLYYWGLTALFHDIGYPFQLAHEQVKSYAESLWGENIQSNPFVSYENMDVLLTLKHCAEERAFQAKTVCELLTYGIQYRLGYPSDKVLPLLDNRHKNQRKYMDHAYFSAVLLAHQLDSADMAIDEMRLDVLTAIALHNSLNRYDIAAALHTETAIPPERHPLAYLLVLCDELQNWDRTAFGNVSKKDPLAWKIDLDFSPQGIAVTYLFDSFDVVDTQPVKEAGDAQRNHAKIVEFIRLNANVKAVQSGEFIKNICGLIRCHCSIEAKAAEEIKNKKTHAFASDDKFINLCDFARAIHLSYQAEYGGPDFGELSLEFKLSNIEQAKSYADKLELVNCFYSDKELDYPVVKGFTRLSGHGEGNKRDDLGFLAREEHLRWVREKLASGWKYGTEYETREERNAKKIHKCIVPFDCLSDQDKSKDELMIANMIPLLYHYGHGVRIYSYRFGWKPVLDIAGCGHRTVKDTPALRKTIKDILSGYQERYRVVVRTNFAFGADQIIAECANELGITIKAALPAPYEEYIRMIREDARQYRYSFTDDAELRMRHLLAQTVSCKVIPDEKYIYLAASKYIINKSRKLIALWDGVETLLKDEKGNPINQGGTYHNICLAKTARGLKDEDIHIIPCER